MRAPWALPLLALCGGAAVALASGCGPSLRRIHLADAYFERCYGGDRDARATDPERRACWQAWLASWRDGQAIERIDYAEERVMTLDPARAAILAIALTDESMGGTLAEPDGPEGDPAAEAGARDGSMTDAAAGTTADGTASGVPDAEVIASTPSIAPDDGTTSTPDAAAAARAEELHRRHRPLTPRTSSPSCAATCEPTWTGCVDACTEDDDACVRACRLRYRTCTRGCF